MEYVMLPHRHPACTTGQEDCRIMAEIQRKLQDDENPNLNAC